jgi:hypothetical protein
MTKGELLVLLKRARDAIEAASDSCCTCGEMCAQLWHDDRTPTCGELMDVCVTR